MKEKTPERPTHIPKEAIWSPEGECREYGDWGIAGLTQVFHKKRICGKDTYAER